MQINNLWLTYSNARKIAAELQAKYFGLPKGLDSDPLEDDMLEDFFQHPLNNGEMWLNIVWDDNDCMLWLQVGCGGHGDAVPR